MLRPRGMGIMDYIAKTGADLLTPPQASPVFQSQTPLQQSMGRPQVQFSQPSAATMATTMPSGMMTMASPTPQVQQQFAPRSTGMPTPPQVTPRIGGTDMGGAGVRMTQEQLAEQAAKAVKIEQERPEIAAQPGFMKTVTDFFGDRENMLRLAAGFNAMTLRPDTGLASIINSELEDIRARKVSSKTVPAIISFLRSKGYEEYAKVVEQNPAMAKTVYEQVIQKELKPGATAKTSGVQYDAQGRAFVNVSKDGSQSIEFLKDAQGNQIMGETTQDKQDAELAAAKMQAQYASAQKYSDSVLKKADNLDQQLQLFDRAIEALGEGAQTGPIDQFLPSVRAASRELETIANELGITVINSATFGALSESELRLALDTNLPLGLNEGELKKFLRRKMAAVTKLKAEILNKAVDMRTMPYDEFLKKQRDEAQENVRFLTPPSDFQPIGGVQWDDMTLQEKKQYMELSQ